MTHFRVALILVALATLGMQQKPAFEVASMKVNKELGPVGDIPKNADTSPGHLTMRDVPLRYMLEWAYDLKDYEVAGPEWIKADTRYDVVAIAPGPATDDEMRPMLQTLLTDRLQIKLHRETRELPVYVLLPGKGAAKLTAPVVGVPQGITASGSGQTVFHGFPLSRLTFLLTRRMDRPVIDLTDIKGMYDYSLDLSGLGFNGNPPPEGSTGPSIFTAIQNDLGLKLEARKHPVEILVVDSAERTPKDGN